MLEELRTIIAIEGISQHDGLEARTGRLNLTDKERKDRIEQMRILARKANPEKYKKTQAAYRKRIKNKDIEDTPKQNKVKLSVEESKERRKKRLLERIAENPELYKRNRREYRNRTKEHRKNRDKSYYIMNKERYDTYYKERYWKNKDKLLKINKKYRSNNVEKLKQHRKKRQSISNYYTSIYSANKIKEIPMWLTLEDLDRIKQIYKDCKLKTKEEGIRYSVDHFYPLNSDWVCGLHCPSNLRIIPFNENCSKQNRRTEEHLNA